jgi:TolB-like protein
MRETLARQPQAELSVRLERFTTPSVNVIGVVRGTDPALRDEYVVFSSHQDANGVRVTPLGAAYTLERELGGGGMSRVFVAREEALGRDVVVKVLAPELAAGLSAERFAREIRLAALQEPHIVPVHAAGVTADGLPWYTMPYVEGESLRARLARGPVPPAEAVKVLGDVARALAYAHARGIVHRDVKPENVLLSSGTAVVTDFGIAKALQQARTRGPGRPGDPGGRAHAGGDVVGHARLHGARAGGRRPRDGPPGRPVRLGRGRVRAARRPAPVRRQDVAAGADGGALRGDAGAAAEGDPARARRARGALPREGPGAAAGLGGRAARGARHGAPRERVAAVRERAPGAWCRSPWRSSPSRCSAAARGPGVRARGRRPRAAPDAPPLVAVLPFETAQSGGVVPDSTFADGLGDAITGKLARLQGLRVIDRTSVRSVEDAARRPQAAGRTLGADYVLRATLRWARGADGQPRVQVSPVLVRVADGGVRWAGEPTVVTPSDPFAAQAALATEVVDALDVALAPAERTRLAAAGTRDTAALAAIERARRIRSTGDSLSPPERPLRALREYEFAYRRDPTPPRRGAGRPPC